MKISILGYGTFGSAIASRLVLKGHDILINEVLNSDIIFVATPSFRVREALVSHREYIKEQKIVICSKGFSEDGDLLSNVLEKEFPNNSVYFLYGPTLAEELAKGNFSAMVLAGVGDKDLLKKEIESDNLKIELSDDFIGAQVGATMKNVVTIFVGIAEGASLGQNTQAYIFTKGLEEIKKLGVALGANPCTFIGLTCLGDLTLHSRNRRIGVEIGKGRNVDEVVLEVKHTQEGLNTIKNSRKISEKIGIELPFVEILNSIIFEGLSVEEGIKKIK